VHIVEVNVPVEFVVKVTVPVGVVGLDDVSVIVAVQVDADPTLTELGAHVTDVAVELDTAAVDASRNVP
jgi:hypothetical protein